MADFKFQKQKQLAKQDKSHKQSWDKAIIPLCNKLNKKKNYYTTSSCAGRIILLKAKDKKEKGVFFFRTHNKITFEQLKKELEKIIKKSKELVYLKQEPAILHVACENLKDAESLLNKAKLAGWKRSGIIAKSRRIICELMSTEKIELPIVNRGKILVSGDYLKLLVREVNKKLAKTREKIKRLQKLL